MINKKQKEQFSKWLKEKNIIQSWNLQLSQDEFFINDNFFYTSNCSIDKMHPLIFPEMWRDLEEHYQEAI
jgi:hypothetical protein